MHLSCGAENAIKKGGGGKKDARRFSSAHSEILISISPTDIRLIHLLAARFSDLHIPSWLSSTATAKLVCLGGAARKPRGSIVYHGGRRRARPRQHSPACAPGIWRCCDNPAYRITCERGLYIPAVCASRARAASLVPLVSFHLPLSFYGSLLA